MPLVLRDLPPSPARTWPRCWSARRPRRRPLWSVLHSGPAEEVAELLAYARELARAEDVVPAFLLVTRTPPACPDADVCSLDVYPAWPLFPRSARIVTACGFNVMRQTEAWRARHRFLPLPRRFDDQFARAARARRGRREA